MNVPCPYSVLWQAQDAPNTQAAQAALTLVVHREQAAADDTQHGCFWECMAIETGCGLAALSALACQPWLVAVEPNGGELQQGVPAWATISWVSTQCGSRSVNSCNSLAIILAGLQQSELRHRVDQLLQQDGARHGTCCSACQ